MKRQSVRRGGRAPQTIVSIRARRAAVLMSWVWLALVAGANGARAQQRYASGRLAAAGSHAKRSSRKHQSGRATQPQQSGEEDDFIKPERPSDADTADFQRPGVLQLEYGYDSDFRGDETRAEQLLPLRLRFPVTSRLLLDLEAETLRSETGEETRQRRTGTGDTRVGFQVLALEESEGRPALAFAYRVKLPTASEDENLGTNRVDHRLAALLSKSFGRTDVDVNAALLVNGREGADGYVTGGQGALAVLRRFENRFGVTGEISGQTKDERTPKGLFALGGVIYKVNRRLQFDAGLRIGLTPDSPRVGFTGGFTVGVADFYRRER